MENKNVILKSYSLIQSALERRRPLPSYRHLKKAKLDLEYGGFLSLVVKYQLHEAINIKEQSLEISWEENHNYIKQAMEISQNNEGNWLDREEVQWIKDSLGDPPLPCCPIYFITIADKCKEKIVYIGKTSSRTSRFAGGHRVAMQLHKPCYRLYKKSLYLCLVVLIDKDNDYLPLEWIWPQKKAQAMLESIESQLIYEFQPDLNVQNKNSYNAAHPFQIHIQDGEKFSLLFPKDYFVDPK